MDGSSGADAGLSASPPGRQPPLDIFISYRRNDSSAHAGRLADILVDRFGRNSVFMDIDTIEPGVDYAEVIDRAIGHCDVLIALIGPRWFGAADARGRRLDNPHDFVRLEIEAALDRNIRVIPTLVGGADMPHADELPGILANLAKRNAVELSDRRFRSDVQFLIEAIENIARQKRGLEGSADLADHADDLTRRRVDQSRADVDRSPGAPRATSRPQVAYVDKSNGFDESRPKTRLPRFARHKLLAAVALFLLLLVASGGYVLVRSQSLAARQPAFVARSPSSSSSSSSLQSSPSAAPSPLHAIPPKGPLVWKASMDGTGADVQQPRVIISGGQTGSDIKLAKGYMEFDILVTGGVTGYYLQNYRTKAYVGEIDVAFKPGTDVNLWWTITSDADATGGYAVWIDSANENVTVLHQLVNASTADFRSASAPINGLQQGQVSTIAAVVNGHDIVVYVNERQVIQVHAAAPVGATNGQLFVNGGQPGWYRIFGIRYYALPGG